MTRPPPNCTPDRPGEFGMVPPMSDDAVLFEATSGIGVITLNRPDNRNSMTPELLDAFEDACRGAATDNTIRCLVITGRGRCFCAGADFKATLQRETAGRPLRNHERSYAMYAPFLAVVDIPVPVIGALNGHTVGGGFGLSLLCDVRLARRDAKYGANFARLGLHSGLGISYLLPRIIGASRAAEMLFTGELIDGAEAQAIGLVSRALPEDEVLPAAMTMATRIAANAPWAVREMKRSLYDGLGWHVRDAAAREAYAQAASLQMADAKEGMDALLAKREPVFRDE